MGRCSSWTTCFHRRMLDLESLTQVQDCVVLAREQRIHTDTGLCRKLFEAVPHQFVGDEYFALLIRQLVQSGIELLR